MFEGTGVKRGDRIPGLVGWEYHGDPPGIEGPGSRRGGHGLGRRPDAPEMDRDDLPRPQGQFRVQRLDDLLGPGPVVAAGAYPALVSLVAPARSRPARADGSPRTCSIARSVATASLSAEAGIASPGMISMRSRSSKRHPDQRKSSLATRWSFASNGIGGSEASLLIDRALFGSSLGRLGA